MVGIDHADDRNAKLGGFGNRAFVIADVDHENSVRNAVHVLDAADGFLQFHHLALEHQPFLLAQFFDGAVLDRRFHLFQALDRNLDRFEIGQHAAQPALIDVRHAGALRFGGDDVASLALGADHQDRAAIGCKLTNVFHRLLVHTQGFFQVDDMDFIAMTENERGHLGVPEAGLVTEMDTGFQHFAHCYRHNISRVGSGIRSVTLLIIQ